jgi:hypothetical protein
MTPKLDPARIDTRHEIRTLSFENPTGARGRSRRCLATPSPFEAALAAVTPPG